MDPNFIHKMIDYKTEDNAVATALLQKMENRKQFLTEEMIPFALSAEMT